MAVKKEIVDSFTDFFRVIRTGYKELGDGFQGQDLIRLTMSIMDDDEDKRDTIVAGFIADLPKMKEEIKGWTVQDSVDTVRAIEDELGPLQAWEVSVIDTIKNGAITHMALSTIFELLKNTLESWKKTGEGVPLPPGPASLVSGN